VADRLTGWLQEARRRRVFRTAGVYLVAVWGVSQGAVELAPLFGAPDWALRAGLIGAVALLPVVVVLAWMFDIGRRGIVRDPEDVRRQQEADEALAAMPTVLGGEEGGAGAVVVRWGDGQGDRYAVFTEAFSLGRGPDCRVRFYDPLVSRQHARVFPDEQGVWRIEDLQSRNGTLVDGLRIEHATLDRACEVRLNEAGPALRLECVPPGADTRRALATAGPGTTVAHVRLAPTGLDRSRGSGTLDG